MTTPDFVGLLREAMGLDAASIGTSAVDIAVRTRVAALGIADREAYRELLGASPAELQALIEAVVVPETWFFRDREAFTALARHVTDEWLPAHPDGTLRVLSLPCSTGEEPYSLVMALLDCGFPGERCHIDAVDISAQALARARHGVYRRNSFRGTDLAFRSRHFVVTGDGYRINDALRDPVCFHQGNLLADDLLPGGERYDAVFCRNLLIYFDGETQDRALRILLRLLTPEGLLFVGPSEGALPLRHDLDAVREPLSFAFRRRGSARPPRREVPALPAPCIARTVPAMPAGAATRAPKPLVAPAESTSESAVLEKASELADQGHLAAAARLCEEALRQFGPSVRAFYLLGLIASAGGDLATAGRYYRKALYLDQGHYDSLAHLSLLLEQTGDVAAARILRHRMQRLKAGSPVA